MTSRVVRFALGCIFSVQFALGQQTAPSSSPSPGQTRQAEHEKRRKEDSQRMLGLLPQFGVTNEKNPEPMTPRQKFRLFYRSASDPVEFAVTGLEAGISQANNSFAEYGQGASGYAKRYGAAFTDQVSSDFFGNFAYPVILKQDPRYFRLGEGPLKRRIGHALVQEFVGHKDGGGKTFNCPTVLGALTAGSISNAYYPAADRGVSLTLTRAGVSLFYGSLAGLGSEFWPDIARKPHRHKEKLPQSDQTQKK